MRCLVFCCLTMGLLTLPVGKSPATESNTEWKQEQGFELHSIEKKLLHETNTQRARYGLKPLELDPELVQSARQHAAWMCSSGSLTHTSKSVGENIALGQSSAKEALQDWMNSSGHRANILSGEYTRIGVAAYQIGEDGQIYWCQQFLR